MGGEALRVELLSRQPVKLEWNLEPDQISTLATAMISACDTAHDKISAMHAAGMQLTWENSIGLLEEADTAFKSLEYVVKFPSRTAVCKELRNASKSAAKQLAASNVARSSRKDVHEVLVAFSQTAEALAMDGERRRYLERRLINFRRMGMELEADAASQVKEINTRLSELVIEFEANLDDFERCMMFTEAELDGCPASFLAERKQDDGKFKLQLNGPSVRVVNEDCKVAETRRQVVIAWGSRCKDTNTPMLLEFASLRDKKAHLMGYPTHLEFVAESLMSGSAEKIETFLLELGQKLKPLAEADLAVLRELKMSHEGGGEIMEWDRLFYCKLVEKTKYGVDHEALKEHFPIDKVTAGLLSIYEELLGLKFESEPSMEGAAAWHEDVKAYRATDVASGKLIGFFYMDLHPREGKTSSTACYGLQRPCLLHGQWQLPISGIVCNFSKPTSEAPALLTHKEVVDLFHEFGHSMHHVCSEAQLCLFSGMGVEKDFLEVPSQLLENWPFSREALNRISGHYKTGEAVPAELFDALIAASNANAGIKNIRDVVWASIDVAVHTTSSPDPADVWNKLCSELVGMPPAPGTMVPATIVHFVDYDGMFYSYLWSEVYSADMFASRFEKEGIFNPETGAAYRKEILAPAGSRDGMDSLKAFLGREPTVDAFIEKKIGLVTKCAQGSTSVHVDKKKEAAPRQQLGELSNSMGSA